MFNRHRSKCAQTFDAVSVDWNALTRLPALLRDASHSPSDSCSTSQRKFEKNVAETLFHSTIYTVTHECLYMNDRNTRLRSTYDKRIRSAASPLAIRATLSICAYIGWCARLNAHSWHNYSFVDARRIMEKFKNSDYSPAVQSVLHYS